MVVVVEVVVAVVAEAAVEVKMKNKKIKNKIGLLVLVLALGVTVILSGCWDEDKSISDDAILNDDPFSIPLSDISTTAKFYEHETVKFFAVEANDGTIKTGFDACDVCGYAKKGYKQEGPDMVCNNCGNRYSIVGLGTENRNPGGCWPGYLQSKIIGDNLIIQKADIEDGKWRFE